MMHMAPWETGNELPFEIPEGDILSFHGDAEQIARATYAATGMGGGLSDVTGWIKEHAAHLALGFLGGYLGARYLAKRSRPGEASFAMNPRKKRRKGKRKGKRKGRR